MVYGHMNHRSKIRGDTNNHDAIQAKKHSLIKKDFKKASNLVVASVKEKMFKKVKNSSDRNTKIYQAYNEGFSQHAVAENLGLSQPYINRIVKKMREK